MVLGASNSPVFTNCSYFVIDLLFFGDMGKCIFFFLLTLLLWAYSIIVPFLKIIECCKTFPEEPQDEVHVSVLSCFSFAVPFPVVLFNLGPASVPQPLLNRHFASTVTLLSFCAFGVSVGAWDFCLPAASHCTLTSSLVGLLVSFYPFSWSSAPDRCWSVT